MLTMFGGSPKREIMFRARRMAGLLNPEPHGPWVYGYIVVERTRDDDVDTMTKMYTKEDPFHGCVVEPWTVGQYAGLDDKNGTKIFEGDIVIAMNDDPDCAFCGVVVYGHGSFEIRDADTLNKDGWCMCLAKCEGFIFEVIGNIHENPNFLKGE